jgi:hypothetical protein
MRVFSLVVSLTALSFLLPGVSSAQNLADAAAKEKERRKGHSGRVYTEEDLRRAGGARGREAASAEPAVATADATAATKEAAPKDGAAAEGTAKPKTDDELKAERETAWRQRLAKANADVARLSAEADTLQQGANDLSQNLYGASRAGQLAKLEETRKQLAAAKDSVGALEDEGRRSGFRP